MTTKQIPTDGRPLTCDAGTHTVNLQQTIEGGYTMYVRSGPNTIDELTDQFADEHMARHAARSLVVKLRAGISIHELIADRVHADQGLAASVKQTMLAAAASYRAQLERDQEIGVQVMAEAANRPRNIGAYAYGTPNQRRRTTPLTDAMRRALQHAQDGVIHAQPGVTKPTLRALELSGLGTTHSDDPNVRYGCDRIELNERGLRMAAEQQGVAA